MKEGMTMNMQARPHLPPMSGEQRSLLRRAVATHPGWKGYREARSLSMDKLTNGALWDAAFDLGIDAVTVINGPIQHKPRPFSQAICLKLFERLMKVRPNLTNKEARLCTDIFQTIREKQEGQATVKQFELIDRIVTHAEANASVEPYKPTEPVPSVPAI